MQVLAGQAMAVGIAAMMALGSDHNLFARTNSGPVPTDLPKDLKPLYTAPDRVTEDLISHGVGTSEQALIEFLKNGLQKTSGLPERPLEKSQLVIDAMAVLSKLKSKAAVPVIMQIAKFDTSLGAFKVIELDVQRTSPQARDEFRVRAYRLIQYNAINALGLMGDIRAAALIRTILTQEQAAGAQIQYALCLASLGDSSGLDYLIPLINLQNRRESAAAARAFYMITGQDFGFTEDSPVRARKAFSVKYAQWWNQNRDTFSVNPAAVIERRLNPKTETIYAARSTRDLLKLASNYFDFNNTLGSADARTSIKNAGTSLNKEFERIALDPMEDLDVRMEAMNWYFEANRSDPLELLKKLRRDENPEITDKAHTLIDQIADEAQKRGGR